MINIIRGIIKDIAGLVSTTAYRVYEAYGRPDEVIRGRLYQHYGFRSVPPEGVEVLTLQQGNNNFSMAEMDGQAVNANNALESGDTFLYSAGDNFVWLTNEQSFSIYINAKKAIALTNLNGDITISCMGSTSDINLETDGQINIAAKNEIGNGPTYQVVATKAFVDAMVNAFNTHTHPYVNVTAPATTSATTTPVVVTTPMESVDTKVS